MRFSPFLAVALAVAGMSATQPAAAERSLAPAVTLGTPDGMTASADQYRDHRYRDRYRYGRRHGYRPDYRYRGYRGGYRRGRLVCRTTWRYHRPYRRCWRAR